MSIHFTDRELNIEFATDVAKAAGHMLMVSILDPIREHIQEPFIITSGRRSPAHNSRVGGEETSQHLYLDGNAACDGYPKSHNVTNLFDWVRLESKLPIDQVILEYDEGIARIIHLSINNRRLPRYEALVGMTGGVFKGRKYTKVEYRL